MKGFAFKFRQRFSVVPVLVLAGTGLAAYGISLVSLPAALMFGGVVLILAAVDMRT